MFDQYSLAHFSAGVAARNLDKYGKENNWFPKSK